MLHYNWKTQFPPSSTIVSLTMNRVKYFYFTSIIWTIVVLFLLVVFFYNPSTLFIDKLPCSDPNETTREMCICSTKFCVNKCCAWGEEPHENYTSYLCSLGNQSEQELTFAKSLQYYTSKIDTTPKTNRGKHFEIFIDFITSERKDSLYSFEMSDVRLFANGTILLYPDNGLYYSPSRYCLDTVKSNLLKIFITENEDDDDGEPDDDSNDSTSVWPTVLTSASVVFFILTLSVYAVLSKLQTLSGKCLMCYILCMLMSYSGILYFQRRDVNASNYIQTCATVGKFLIMYPSSMKRVVSSYIFPTLL